MLLANVIEPCLLYSSELGALTQLYANTAPETGEEGGQYYVPWARKGATAPAADSLEAQDKGTSRTDTAAAYFDAQIAKHAQTYTDA